MSFPQQENTNLTPDAGHRVVDDSLVRGRHGQMPRREEIQFYVKCQQDEG